MPRLDYTNLDYSLIRGVDWKEFERLMNEFCLVAPRVDFIEFASERAGINYPMFWRWKTGRATVPKMFIPAMRDLIQSAKAHNRLKEQEAQVRAFKGPRYTNALDPDIKDNDEHKPMNPEPVVKTGTIKQSLRELDESAKNYREIDVITGQFKDGLGDITKPAPEDDEEIPF